MEQRNLETIASICRALDGNAPTDNVFTALAVAQWRVGNVVEARALAEQTLTSVLSGRLARHLAKELLARIDTPPQAVATPPATQTETRAAK